MARSVTCTVALAGACLVVMPRPAALGQTEAERSAVAASLRSPDAETRRDATMRLGARGDAGAASLIAPLLDDSVEVVRATAAGTLGRLRARDAVGALVARLAREKRPSVRKEIAYALGEIGDRSAVGPLTERLARERDKEVRAATVTALGAIGDVTSVATLSARLGDKEAFVRREAARALGRVGDRSAVPALVDRLASDVESDVRRHAAEALGRLGDERARGPLTTATQDSDPYVVAAAIEALAALDRAAKGTGGGSTE